MKKNSLVTDEDISALIERNEAENNAFLKLLKNLNNKLKHDKNKIEKKRITMKKPGNK